MAKVIDRHIAHIDADAIMDPMEAGDRVEVRSRFDQRWSNGFEVVEVVSDGGVRVRRISDGALLPIVFDADEVRPERNRRRSMWWY